MGLSVANAFREALLGCSSIHHMNLIGEINLPLIDSSVESPLLKVFSPATVEVGYSRKINIARDEPISRVNLS